MDELPFSVAGLRKRRARAAKRLRDQGLSLREIGERLGISHATVIADLASLSHDNRDDEESPDVPIHFHG